MDKNIQNGTKKKVSNLHHFNKKKLNDAKKLVRNLSFVGLGGAIVSFFVSHSYAYDSVFKQYINQPHVLDKYIEHLKLTNDYAISKGLDRNELMDSFKNGVGPSDFEDFIITTCFNNQDYFSIYATSFLTSLATFTLITAIPVIKYARLKHRLNNNKIYQKKENEKNR